MTVWNIRAEDEGVSPPRARLTLTGDGEARGIISIPMSDYADIWRRLMLHLRDVSRETIEKALTERVWHDALSTYPNAEIAKEKLIEAGWSAERVERYADEIAREIAKRLAASLPGGS